MNKHSEELLGKSTNSINIHNIFFLSSSDQFNMFQSHAVCDFFLPTDRKKLCQTWYKYDNTHFNMTIG